MHVDPEEDEEDGDMEVDPGEEEEEDEERRVAEGGEPNAVRPEGAPQAEGSGLSVPEVGAPTQSEVNPAHRDDTQTGRGAEGAEPSGGGSHEKVEPVSTGSGRAEGPPGVEVAVVETTGVRTNAISGVGPVEVGNGDPGSVGSFTFNPQAPAFVPLDGTITPQHFRKKKG